MMRLFLLVLLFHLLADDSAAASTCGGEVFCPLADRGYHLRLPDEWDGRSPLPVLLHFHGWGRQGDLVIRHSRIAGATRRRGVLLLAPNGRGRTWNFWRAESDDVAFAAEVIEDAARRLPIDRSRIYVSGYSFGAAMAWRFACERGGLAGLLAVSGTIPQDVACPAAPPAVRHVHGTSDTVMRYPFGPGGDPTGPVALWRARMGCGAGDARGPYNIRPFLTFERTAWACAKGAVTLDTHPGGHFIPHGWIGWQLDELMGRTPVYP